ncbi:MAG: signal peptidase I [Acidobacteriota bacterium]
MTSTKASPAAHTSPPKSVAREYLETIVVCVLFLLAARGFVFMQSQIPSGSMLGTLLIGDYVLVNRAIYAGPGDTPISWLGQREIRRGDVIVFRFPGDPDLDYIKRVIALPNERVELRAGTVFINGQAIEEPYLLPENVDPSQNFAEHLVPNDSYFCLGDNRDQSSDSRVWGYVPRSLVKGRAAMVLYSYDVGDGDPIPTGVGALVSFGKKLLTFPVRTRWSRVLTRIH